MSVPPGATSIKVELDFQFETSDTARWVGVGIGDGDSDSTFFKEPAGMLLCLSNQGGGRFCAGPNAVNIANKAVPLAKPGEFNHLTLVYNIPGNTVSAWINGVEMGKENTPSPVPITPSGAGFACFGIGPEAKIDNFTLTASSGATTAAQP
ncbi:MAG: hypothetical protein WDO13_16475 [Verrucomicrobiota bacterium]